MQVIGIPISSVGRIVLRAGGTFADFATNALAGLSGADGDDDCLLHDPWLVEEG